MTARRRDRATRDLQVGQTATLDLGRRGRARTSSPSSLRRRRCTRRARPKSRRYVSPKQIEALPQNSRNFLAFADTVPGVLFVTSGDGSTSEIAQRRAGCNGVNVFIDGVGQKNYVLRAASAARLSRGNPFPQLAIGEYKVITSNYKAEFDQLSSAAVVAVTRSGTNEFERQVFCDHTDEHWRADDPIEQQQATKAEAEQDSTASRSADRSSATACTSSSPTKARRSRRRRPSRSARRPSSALPSELRPAARRRPARRSTKTCSSARSTGRSATITCSS